MLKSATKLDTLADRMSWEILTPKESQLETSSPKNGPGLVYINCQHVTENQSC